MKLVILLSLVALLSTSQVEAFAPTLKVASAQKESSLRMTNDISRRSWLDTVSTAFVVGASPLLLPGEKALAEDNQFTSFVDKACGFKISVPADWEMSEQTLPDRRRIVLFVDPATNDSPNKTLMFAAFTPVRDDYTSLSSFGSVDQVSQNLSTQVDSLPKRESIPTHHLSFVSSFKGCPNHNSSQGTTSRRGYGKSDD